MISGVLSVGWLILRGRRGRWSMTAAPLFRQAVPLLVLYAIWLRLGEEHPIGPSQAADRARWIWHVEKWLPFPSELTLQRWTLHATWLVRFANGYYIAAHVVPMGIFLVWLYVRHPDRVPRWRNQLGFLSIVGAIIQFLPVAPPRLMPEFGFIDTAARFGPRVYDSSGFKQAGQLAAMPSMHIGWAVLIAFATFSASRSRWRWIGPAHALLTFFAVTVTAYHWLLDSLVAVLILLIGLGIAAVFRRVVRRKRCPVSLTSGRSNQVDRGPYIDRTPSTSPSIRRPVDVKPWRS